MTDKEVAQHYVNEVLEQAALAVERLEIGEGEVSRHYGAIYAAVIRGLKR